MSDKGVIITFSLLILGLLLRTVLLSMKWRIFSLPNILSICKINFSKMLLGNHTKYLIYPRFLKITLIQNSGDQAKYSNYAEFRINRVRIIQVSLHLYVRYQASKFLKDTACLKIPYYFHLIQKTFWRSSNFFKDFLFYGNIIPWFILIFEAAIT